MVLVEIVSDGWSGGWRGMERDGVEGWREVDGVEGSREVESDGVEGWRGMERGREQENASAPTTVPRHAHNRRLISCARHTLTQHTSLSRQNMLNLLYHHHQHLSSSDAFSLQVPVHQSLSGSDRLTTTSTNTSVSMNTPAISQTVDRAADP